MTFYSASNPFMQIFNLQGTGLNDGDVYFGVAGQDPITNPKTVYWDLAGTDVAAQPIPTTGGYLYRNGTPAEIYLDSIYSIKILDKKGGLVYYQANVEDALFAFIGEIEGPAGAGLIGFSQSQTYPASSLGAKGKDTVSVKDAPFGAKGDGSTDDTAAIAAAIAFAAAKGARVYFPAGTYKVTPTTNFVGEGATYQICFPILSNMDLEGDVGTTIRIANGVSTDGAPVRMAMFATNQVVSNISVKSLTLDMNGTNNPISPGRGAGTYNLFAQSQFMVSGTPGGVAASASNVLFRDVNFINSPGTNCVVMGQTNTPGLPVGSGWVFDNCRGLENGTDTSDHTTVYGWADDVKYDKFYFKNSTPAGTVGLTGVTRNVEIHGNDHKFINCDFINSVRGISVGYNTSGASSSRPIVSISRFGTLFYGIEFYAEQAAASTVSDTTIAVNVFNFDDTVFAAVPALNAKACIVFAGKYAHKRAKIRNNLAYKTGTTVASAFVSIEAASVAGQIHDDLVVTGNDAYGFVIGVRASTGPTNGLGVMDFRGNNWHNFSPAGAYSQAIGEHVTFNATPQPIQLLMVGSGSAVDNRGSPAFNYGRKIEGLVTNFYQEMTSFSGLTVANIDDSAATITTRSGFHQKIPFVPVLKFGGVAAGLGTGGTAVGFYSINGSSVSFNFEIVLGTSPTLPGGNATISLPIVSTVSGIVYSGGVNIKNSTPYFAVLSLVGGNSDVDLQITGGNVSASAPVAMAAGTLIAGQISDSIAG